MLLRLRDFQPDDLFGCTQTFEVVPYRTINLGVVKYVVESFRIKYFT